ncbi:MAG: OmpA family protein [Rubrivivax sp.]
MKPLLLRSIAAAAALAAAAGVPAQTTLAPAAQRIDDRAISADQQGYERLQGRIRALNDGGRPLRDRHLAQAQCWLDTSFHEYTRNDRGPWPQAALAQSEALVQAMEARAALPADTPLVAGAERLRPDLWARAAALRSHAGAACAQARTACAEVELVHAGHEQVQLGWRHARPYVQIAEDLIDEAEAQARSCAAPAAATQPAPAPLVAQAAPAPAPAAAPVVAPAPVTVTVREPGEVVLVTQVVFRFDRHSIADVPAGGLVVLQALLQRLREERLELQAVELTGHADRLRSPSRPGHNQWLSEQRVAAVRDHLVALGVAAGRIRVQALGDSAPRAQCDASAAQGAALRDCLLPDRRVEVTVRTRRP